MFNAVELNGNSSPCSNGIPGISSWCGTIAKVYLQHTVMHNQDERNTDRDVKHTEIGCWSNVQWPNGYFWDVQMNILLFQLYNAIIRILRMHIAHCTNIVHIHFRSSATSHQPPAQQPVSSFFLFFFFLHPNTYIQTPECRTPFFVPLWISFGLTIASSSSFN